MEEYKEKIRKIYGLKHDDNIEILGNTGRGRGSQTGRIYSVMTQEQLDAIERQRAISYDKRHFSFTHMRFVREITDNLSNRYCGYILMLQPYIQFRSNILINKDNEPMKYKDIAKALDVTVKTARNVIKKLEQDYVLFITQEGHFKMNERYHFRRKAGSDRDMLVKTFFTTLKELKLKPAELGALYKLLPYVHFETNMICADPFEENPANIRFLSQKEIAKIIGLHEKKAIQVIRELKRAGAVAETSRYAEDLRVKFLIINPDIIFRQAGRPNASLQATFKAKPNEI